MAKPKKEKFAVNWIPVIGTASISNGQINFDGTSPQDNPIAQVPLAIVRSNKLFDGGFVECEVFLGSEISRVHFIFNDMTPHQVFAGPNYGNATYGIALYSQRQGSGSWEPLSVASQGFRAPAKRWLKIRVDIEGSIIRLTAEGVEVCRAEYGILPSPLAFYFDSGPAKVRNIVIKDVKAEAFVVMKFGGVFDTIFKDVIAPVCNEFGIRAIRGDEEYTNGQILNDIVNGIRRSSVVIADITPDNPNVYYEVGYAHAIHKPIILLCDKARERLPFDLSGFRTIFYENSIGGKQEVEEKLRRHLSQQFSNVRALG